MWLGSSLSITNIGTLGGLADAADGAASGAALFLADYGPHGMVIDFEDASISINDAADLLDFNSSGQVSGGALVGPGAKLTYTAPSVKLTEQADGFIKFQAHNLYLNSAAPANQSVTTGMLTGATYAITLTGSVSITLSGAATGTITAGTTTFTAASGTLTCGSTSGSGTVHLRRTPSVDTYVATAGAQVYNLPYVYSGGVRTGKQGEPAATNLALRSNDFTNASWTKSNMTAALTATGPDGVANSASTLTATAGNATALQAITSASSSRVTSVYVKRRTGSGNIDLTQDNGTTWTTQTVTSSWTRVALAPVTSTNPTVGIRIVTSGDEVDVLCFQHETGTVATSPIITYGSTVLRAADAPEIATSLFPYNVSEGTLYIKAIVATPITNARILNLNNNIATIRVIDLFFASPTALSAYKSADGGFMSISSTVIAGDQRVAVRYKQDDYHSSYNGVLGTPDTVTGAMQTATMLEIGHLANGTQNPMIVQKVAYFPDGKANSALQALTA